MFRKLIDLLIFKKNQLQNYEDKKINECEVDIIVSVQNSIYKIEISDYISIIDFFDKMNNSEDKYIFDMVCNCVLWNNDKQKVNKGTYYIITLGNSVYNILFTDDKIIIDERTKKEIDKETNFENIIQESVITFYINNNTYHYYSAKHESNGNTYYIRYYNKNKLYCFEKLELSENDTYEEINSVISNLENINGIEAILDIEFFKKYILNDLKEICRDKILKKY